MANVMQLSYENQDHSALKIAITSISSNLCNHARVSRKRVVSAHIIGTIKVLIVVEAVTWTKSSRIGIAAVNFKHTFAVILDPGSVVFAWKVVVPLPGIMPYHSRFQKGRSARTQAGACRLYLLPVLGLMA